MEWEEKIVNLKLILGRLLASNSLPPETYLAGGTALYFQLHHRLSVDLDFFVPLPFLSENIVAKLRTLFKEVDVEILEKESLIVFLSEYKIKVSLFHLPYPLLSLKSHLEIQERITCPVASLDDLEAMKALALVQRGTAKDFIDLFFILQKNSDRFEDVSRKVRMKYGVGADYDYHLKTSFIYFDDAEAQLQEIRLVDASGKIRPMSKTEWDDIKSFFTRMIR